MASGVGVAFPGAVLAIGASRAASRTCGRSAGCRTTRPTRPRSARHHLRPRQPDEGRRDDHARDDARRRGPARPRRARCARSSPASAGRGKDGVTLRQLLTPHCRGLRWWAPLYQEISRAEAAFLERIVATGPRRTSPARGVLVQRPRHHPAGRRARAAGRGAARAMLARERVLAPLGMADTRLPAGAGARCRASRRREHDPWRGRLLRGRGARRERLRARRRRRARGPVRHARRDLARFAQSAARRWHATRGGGSSRGRPCELFTRRAGIARQHACARLGHGQRRDRAAAAPLRASPATRRPGSLLSRALVRSHRLHRHVAVGRPRARRLRRAAQQPRVPHPRQQTASAACARGWPTPWHAPWTEVRPADRRAPRGSTRWRRQPAREPGPRRTCRARPPPCTTARRAASRRRRPRPGRGPQSSPASAAGWPTTRVKTPRPKTPRVMPVVKPAIVSTASTTVRPSSGPPRAIAICTAPKTSVSTPRHAQQLLGRAPAARSGR